MNVAANLVHSAGTHADLVGELVGGGLAVLVDIVYLGDLPCWRVARGMIARFAAILQLAADSPGGAADHRSRPTGNR